MTMQHLRKRFSIAAGMGTTLLLLVLPSFAGANPGRGPVLVQRSGQLVVLHADRRDGTSTQQWMLVNGTSHVAVHAPDDVWIAPGTPVRLEGTPAGDTLILADSVTAVQTTRVAPKAAAADAAAGAPAIRSVAVILVDFADGPHWGPDDAPAAANVVGNDLNAYFEEQTYGQLGFAATAYGPYDIEGSLSQCEDNLSWMAEAMVRADVSQSQFQHVVLVFPSGSNCPWSGQALIGGKRIWINGAPTLRVLAHEFGHNLGLGHAGGLACANAPVSPACTPSAVYGDPFDPMGGYSGPVRQMNMQHKLTLNLLAPSAVTVVGISGTYHVAPLETLSGTPQLLRIARANGANYYVEYRYPIGAFDSQAPGLQGVLVRTDGSAPSRSDANAADTLLIDMHSATAGNWGDAAMDVGQVFDDPVAGVSIQNLGEDAGGATLAITLRDSVAPNAPSGLTAVASGTSAILHWTAATDDYQVDHYIVSRNGIPIASLTGTDFQDSNLVPGTTVTYTVAAVDASNNTGPAASASLVVPDTIPPSAPANVTARLTRDGRVHLSWSAASDNGRVSYYRVLRGARAIATAKTLTYVDAAPKPGSGPTLTYSVVAVDLTGNVGPRGKAKPLRAALLRTLAATGLTITRTRAGFRVKGRVADAQARCRLRIGRGAWRDCRATASGAFEVTVRANGARFVTFALSNSLGRVKFQRLRVR
jgi:hypothetical protein